MVYTFDDTPAIPNTIIRKSLVLAVNERYNEARIGGAVIK